MRRPKSGAAVPANASSPRLLSGNRPLSSRGALRFRVSSSPGRRCEPRGVTSGTSESSLPTIGHNVSLYEVAGFTNTMELRPLGLRMLTARESIPPHDSPSRMGLSLHRDSCCHALKKASIACTRPSAVSLSSPGINRARSSKCRERSANCDSANIVVPSKPGMYRRRGLVASCGAEGGTGICSGNTILHLPSTDVLKEAGRKLVSSVLTS
mmetsp:Transcript_12248/g.28651  ORF Transcript_12248/g.28651 Transcript_12248/m.28651 type:complete len:211 (-) Transcript_12248:320-952(-)